MALAMAANGAQGETKDEILKTIGINNLDEYNLYTKELIEKYNKTDVLKLNISNSIWINTDKCGDMIFSENFKNNIKEFYFGESDTVNNQNAVDTINSWVDKKTFGKIPSIINSNDFYSAIINALYFKANWANQFNEANTKKDIFTDRNNKKNEIDFMKHRGYYNYYKGDTYKIIELPYSSQNAIYNENGEFERYETLKELSASMFIIMSDDKRLNFENLINNAEFTRTYVDLSIPKFKVEFESNLKDILKQIGINKAFNDKSADFSNMFENLTNNMFITDVFHKTYINVDENGTEAAAVTAVMIEATSAPPSEAVEFKADSPFTYVIRDNFTGEILFIGEYAFAN